MSHATFGANALFALIRAYLRRHCNELLCAAGQATGQMAFAGIRNTVLGNLDQQAARIELKLVGVASALSVSGKYRRLQHMRTGNNRSGEYDASGNPRCGAQVEGAEIGVLRSGAEQLLCCIVMRELLPRRASLEA